jgi:hypothetical protein
MHCVSRNDQQSNSTLLSFVLWVLFYLRGELVERATLGRPVAIIPIVLWFNDLRRE